MVIKKRARQPEQKAERRRAILEAAAGLWHETSYEKFTMSTLASRTGLAKGTLYLYFETKEELFLTLLEDRLEGWMEKASSELRTCAEPGAVVAAEILQSTLEEQGDLSRLLPLLEPVLERDVAVGKVVEFKQRLLNRMEKLAPALERAAGIPIGSGMRGVFAIRALVAGLATMTESNPVVAEAMQHDSRLNGLRLHFGMELRYMLECMLRGMGATASPLTTNTTQEKVMAAGVSGHMMDPAKPSEAPQTPADPGEAGSSGPWHHRY